MIKKLHLKSWLLLLCMIVGASTAWAQEVTILPNDGTAVENSDYSIVKNPVTVSVTSSTLTSDQIRIFKNQTITISSETATITGVVFTCTASGTDKYGPGCFAAIDGYSYEGKVGTWSGSSNSVTLKASSNQVRVTQIVVTCTTGGTPTCATPSFSPAGGSYASAQNVTISTTTEGAAIHYTLDGTEPNANSATYSAAINVSSTTTIKAIATADGYNNSSVATATYNIVQPLTTMDAIFDAAKDAGATATPVVITFNNWVVTGVKGSNAYVTDGTKGFILFGSGHGFEVGNVLSGTATCKVQLYKGAAEITELTSTNTGLIVGDGGTVTPVTNYSIADLSGVNTGAVFSFENLTYDGTNLSDGTNTIKPYTTLFSGTFVNEKSYNVTGVYLQYDDTKEILPRSAEDIEELGDDPIVFNDISDITEVNTGYRVKGTVVATNARGLVIGDGTGYVYYYKNAAVSQSVGDLVSIYGNSATYGHILQFTNTATVAEVTESNYNYTPDATVITEVPDYSEGYYLSTYLQFEGKLSKDNNSYFITLGESKIQISYPTSGQGNALTALNGKTALVKGYFTGINSNNIFTIMLESVEEMAGTDPVINAENVTLAYDANSGEIAYTIENSVDGTSLTAALKESAEWISDIAVTSEKVTFTTTANEGNADRTATITLTYGEVSKEVSVTQKHLVVDYATLPFAYDGNGSGTLPLGLTQNGVGTYNTSPAMKFDGTGDWLILKFNEQPGKLTFDIKGNSFSDGTFKVQTSEDGLTYTDLKSYTVLGNTQNEEFNNLGENVRYIKWIYTEKVGGNVALGNINLVKPGQVLPPVISANNVTIAADATSGEISYSIANPDDGVELTATTDVDWISNIVVSAEKITFSTTANTGDADRTATFILKYEGAESKEVTVTQKHVVADIAGLPFEFDGGKADIANTAGLTYDGLDSDYGSSPKLKFNSTGDYLLLHFNEQPGKLTFAIKGNSFSGGTFKVQTSADGESFTDLGTYTALDETTQSEEFINLSADARFIKWIYTEKVSGNVALGLIKLEKPSNDPIITAEDVTIEANATSGEIAYTITNPIEGTTLSASTDTEWISDVAVSANKVSFTTTENTGAERTGVIKLTYGSVTKEVTVKQKRYVISGNVRYELVNSTDGLTDGQYLIVSSLGEFAVAFDGSLETLDAVSNNKFVTVTNNVIMATDAISFTITAKDGGYSIKSYSGLYIGNTSDANILKTSPSDDYVNAISFDEDGNADVVSAKTYLRYNATSNQDRFRYFKSSSYANQEAIQLFKKVSSTETLLGDVNGDTKVDIADVTKLVNLLLNESESHNPADYPAANLDEDEDLDADDVRALVELILSNQ